MFAQGSKANRKSISWLSVVGWHVSPSYILIISRWRIRRSHRLSWRELPCKLMFPVCVSQLYLWRRRWASLLWQPMTVCPQITWATLVKYHHLWISGTVGEFSFPNTTLSLVSTATGRNISHSGKKHLLVAEVIFIGPKLHIEVEEEDPVDCGNAPWRCLPSANKPNKEEVCIYIYIYIYIKIYIGKQVNNNIKLWCIICLWAAVIMQSNIGWGGLGLWSSLVFWGANAGND